MKKSIALLLFIFLLTGCSMQTVNPQENKQGIVASSITQPTSTPQTTTPEAPQWPERDIPTYTGLGFQEESIRYSGDEIHTKIMLTGKGYKNVGIGLLLFVDGKPQPYKTAENNTLSYMHIFYPEDNVKYYHEFIFTPVTGKAGETVDVQIMGFNDPAYCYGDGEWGAHFAFLSTEAQLTFDATPEKQKPPQVADAGLHWTCTYEDVAPGEIGLLNAALANESIHYEFTLNGEDLEYRFYGAAEGDKITFHLETYGTPGAGYSLVFYMNGNPIYADGDNTMLFEIRDNQKTVIDGEFTLTGFDGKSNVCAMLVPRNSLSLDIQNKLALEDIEVYYFLAVASYEDLLAQVGNTET